MKKSNLINAKIIAAKIEKNEKTIEEIEQKQKALTSKFKAQNGTTKWQSEKKNVAA